MVEGAAGASGVAGRKRRQPPLLMYHWFRPDGTPSHSRSPQLELTPDTFERQLRWLARHGWRSARLASYLSGEALPPKSLVLTVDDGTADFWEHARPALERCGFFATLFVVTGKVGGTSDWDVDLGEPPRRLMDWDQIAELHARGHEIGSHTHTHRDLTRLDASVVRDELERSRDELGRRLGKLPDVVAWPRGRFREEHKPIARAAGYLGACAVVLHWRDLRRADRYALRRMTIKGTESMLRFRLRLLLARRIALAPEAM